MKKLLPLLFLLPAFGLLKANVITHDAQHTMGVNDYVFIDVNNDGVNDYLLSAGDGSKGPITIKGYNGCKVETGGDGKAIGLSDGAPVGNNSWQDSATIYYFGSGVYYFPTNTWAYLGFKLSKNGQSYYGYLQMEISGLSSINGISTLNVGCQTNADEAILAGAQATTPVIEIGALDKLKWQVTNQELKISLGGNLNPQLQLFSADGKMVIQRRLITEVSQIDLSALPAGMYVLALNNGQERYTRKFVKL